jgi:hypothetical protein
MFAEGLLVFTEGLLTEVLGVSVGAALARPHPMR